MFRSAHALPLALFAVCCLFLFRLPLIEGWVFLGDSDRLNSVLNTRLFEIMSLQQRGSIPSWSDQQFMGYSIIGLHWMLTAFSPVPYLLAFLPTAGVLTALTVFSALLLFLTFLTTYWMLGAYTASLVARTAGAVLFALGAFTVRKLLQLDLSFAALTMMPILLLLLRLTRRNTATRTFLALTAVWSFVVLYTVLQEIAYIAMLYASYGLYRSVRMRDGWPATIGALAFICAVTIAASRVLTVAVDIPDVARSSTHIRTSPVEVLRYFGDGLLGRNRDENAAVRGDPIHLYEGVQLLTSSAGAWAVLLAGFLAPTRAARGWAIGLFLVLSIGLIPWWRDWYDRVGRIMLISREILVVGINGVLFGLPLWFVSRWLAARLPAPASLNDTADDRSSTPDTSAAVEDTPYFLMFSALGLAAILIAEGQTLLYYGFLRLDFLHSRLSVAISLPLAALVTIFLSRFLPVRPNPTLLRWIGAGLALGVVLWLLRETAALAAARSLGLAIEELRPRRLLTIETVRVVTSLLVVLAAATVLVLRCRAAPRALVGSFLAGWIVLECLVAADYRINSPYTWEQTGPFTALNIMMEPPGRLQLPTPAQRATVRERLEVDAYRSVLRQTRSEFATLVEPQLAAFWNLRLVEGYSTGIPRRLDMMPWPRGAATPHNLDINDEHQPPWKLLAALNVKYVVEVNRSFWYNPAPGGPNPPFAVERLEVRENPNPVAPRAFFAARISSAGSIPLLIGDDGRRPAPADPPIVDPRTHSVVEGLDAERVLSVDGTLDATFDGDRVTVRVSPSPAERFLVLNERYYAGWRAWTDGRPTEILPTNLAMRGVFVPPGTTLVEFQFVPFLATTPGILLLLGGLALTGIVWWAVGRSSTR